MYEYEFESVKKGNGVGVVQSMLKYMPSVCVCEAHGLVLNDGRGKIGLNVMIYKA